MEFRKIIKINQADFRIGYNNHTLSLGSCFADHMGQKLMEAKFSVLSNPFGVLYNPLSVLNSLNLLKNGRFMQEEDLVMYNKMYHSFFFHSVFSDENAIQALQKMNGLIAEGRDMLNKSDRLIITFGTAWVYEWKESGDVVSNCHKIPASKFERRRLSVTEIVEAWIPFLEEYFQNNPGRYVVFTVSPIRHWKDGAFENQCSKSTLILAIDELCRKYNAVTYFPAYEIFMDELRDYRFYAEDMIHPSQQGIAYVWERFSETYFSKDTLEDIKEWDKLRKMLSHRSLSGMSESYKNFLRENLKRIEQFRQKRPYFDLNLELQQLKELCNTL